MMGAVHRVRRRIRATGLTERLLGLGGSGPSGCNPLPFQSKTPIFFFDNLSLRVGGWSAG